MYRKKTIRFKVAVPHSTFKDILACRDLWQKRYAPEHSDVIPLSEFCVCLLDRAATDMIAELQDRGC